MRLDTNQVNRLSVWHQETIRSIEANIANFKPIIISQKILNNESITLKLRKKLTQYK